ncbi:hypothetical protein MLD38_024582 [Melastoma candidum]|nr:hypothetical protein MLD38_024582 [Melastoma candidum]
MEQCIARLDVAMFNAILQESPDEMSMDPVAVPISDPKVLPIHLASQVLELIGNWSRCLTELFGGVEDCNSTEEETVDHDQGRNEGSFKCFDLLSAVSDLMMLPKHASE